jgi:predicted dehydrogenase
VCIVGLGDRGTDLARLCASTADVRIAALCDVYQPALERIRAGVNSLTGESPKCYDDMRKAFADKEIDVVFVATPNHWHALSTIWACEAGKDVYCEKPASYNVHEGQRMIDVARETGRIVAIGSQSRSEPHKIKAITLLREGVIGKVYMAKALCFKRRRSIGHKEDGTPPPGLNWDMFLGPAPVRPYNELRFTYNWHWFWDTGNGDIGNQGAHEMDVARWGLGDPVWPISVVSTGGKYIYSDDQETPNEQLAAFDYGGRQLIFEARGLLTSGEGPIPKVSGHYIGNLFFGEEGWMEVDNFGFKVRKGEKDEPVVDEKAEPGNDTLPHLQNFLKACRSRTPKDLNADVATGVISADLCHLANASYRAGRKLAVDPANGRFTGPGAEEGNAFLSRQKYREPYAV